MPMKYIVIVPDGMADQPIESLGNKTPLEAANTPNMDALAQKGYTGLVQTIPEGMNPGSDVGNMSLLGYDPTQWSLKRAPLEAANLDINLGEFDIAVRCNFVTVVDGKMMDYSAGHISTKEASQLIDSLNKDMKVETANFVTGKSYRHILKLTVRDPQRYCQIQTIPPHDILNQDIKDHLPQGGGSEIFLKLMEKSRDILNDHSINQVRIDLKENPANMIWLWGQGTQVSLPSFQEEFGLKGAMISAVDLVNGLGNLMGLDVVSVPGITGYYDTNFKGKAEYALKALKDHDFVFVHIEAPDEAGHNGDIKAKIQAIEDIDQHVIGTIVDALAGKGDYRILISSDHPTPVELRTHTSDPVAFVMSGQGVEFCGAEQYNETLASENGLKFQSGQDLLRCFLAKDKFT